MINIHPVGAVNDARELNYVQHTDALAIVKVFFFILTLSRTLLALKKLERLFYIIALLQK